MMEEEDGFDLPPTPDGMADVDISHCADDSRPTLLVAGTSKPSDHFTEQMNNSADIVEQTEISASESQVEGESMTKESLNAEKDNVDDNGLVTDGDSEPASDRNKIKELFGGSAESDGFLVSDSKPSGLVTASALFSGTEDPKDLFGSDSSLTSFPITANTSVPRFEAQHKDDRNSVMASLGESFQDLTVTNKSIVPDFPAGAAVGSSPVHPLTGQGTLSNSGKATPFVPSAAPVHPLTGQGTLSNNGKATPFVPSLVQNVPISSPAYPSTGTFNQGQTPLLYNPQNFSQQQDGMSPDQKSSIKLHEVGNDPNVIGNSVPNVGDVQNRATTVPYQNIANVGNSYMYTAPITSIIPQHEQIQRGSQSAQMPLGRLHQSHVPKQTARPAGELFVPDLYGSQGPTQPNQVNIFTPDSVPMYGVNPSNTPQMMQDTSQNSHTMQSTYGVYQGANQSDPNTYDFGNMQPLNFSNQDGMNYSNANDPSLWEWVKNQPWGEEAQRLGKQILQKTKNATDTVLTTLDPGMEEYLNPVVHLAIASQDSNILQAVRQGFKNVFGHTAAKGHGVQNSFAKLPIGFDLASRAVTEKLDAITAIDFKFSQPYIHVAIQPFITELQQGRWSCMLCLAARDCMRQTQLQTFSQPIQIPAPCISMAYNKTSQEVAQYGLDVDIDEAVRLYQPYAGDQDWCSTLTGIKLESVIVMAAQGLAADYKRELDNPSVTNAESFVVMQ